MRGAALREYHLIHASMAELADAPDLGSGGAIHAGSTPVTRTQKRGILQTGACPVFSVQWKKDALHPATSRARRISVFRQVHGSAGAAENSTEYV